MSGFRKNRKVYSSLRHLSFKSKKPHLKQNTNTALTDEETYLKQIISSSTVGVAKSHGTQMPSPVASIIPGCDFFTVTVSDIRRSKINRVRAWPQTLSRNHLYCLIDSNSRLSPVPTSKLPRHCPSTMPGTIIICPISSVSSVSWVCMARFW